MTQADRIINISYIPLKLNNIIMKAQETQPTYIDFLADALRMEAQMRELHIREVCVKTSRIPPRHDLDELTSASCPAYPNGSRGS